MEVRVIDANGETVPSGEQGYLQVRGCSNFVGYLKRAELDPKDPDGWFDTGDLARMDEAGYIRIAGRARDIIIRGGKNIPVVEAEGLLFKHPADAVAAGLRCRARAKPARRPPQSQAQAACRSRSPCFPDDKDVL